jgi:hypothetical protein
MASLTQLLPRSNTRYVSQSRLHVIRQRSPWSLTATPSERLTDLLASLLNAR